MIKHIKEHLWNFDRISPRLSSLLTEEKTANLYCLPVCEESIACLFVAGPTCKTSRRSLRICIMRTSAQRDLRGRAGKTPMPVTQAADELLHLKHVCLNVFCSVPHRSVDEDVLDKDQILLQKEAEVRTHTAPHKLRQGQTRKPVRVQVCSVCIVYPFILGASVSSGCNLHLDCFLIGLSSLLSAASRRVPNYLLFVNNVPRQDTPSLPAWMSWPIFMVGMTSIMQGAWNTKLETQWSLCLHVIRVWFVWFFLIRGKVTLSLQALTFLTI